MEKANVQGDIHGGRTEARQIAQNRMVIAGFPKYEIQPSVENSDS